MKKILIQDVSHLSSAELVKIIEELRAVIRELQQQNDLVMKKNAELQKKVDALSEENKILKGEVARLKKSVPSLR